MMISADEDSRRDPHVRGHQAALALVARPALPHGDPGAPIRVAVLHTRYRQRGGEDAVVDAETSLLREHGHEVVPIAFDNADLAAGSRVAAATAAIWNRSAARLVRETLLRERPDVLHVHNTWPAASASVFEAAGGVPLVYTLHNYRLACLAATLLRDGRVCEACVGRVPWRGVAHGCYGGDRLASTVLAASLVAQRLRRALRHVDRFVALSAFAKAKLTQAGLPGERIVVKPNFAAPGLPRAASAEAPHALFVGRLSREKGVEVLAAAWRSGGGLPPLEVVGDGPDRALLEGVPGVRLRGAEPPEVVRARMASASVLVMPTLWYEGMPLVVLEAFAAGLPVIGSDLGAVGELVRNGRNGWVVPPGDAEGLASAVREALAGSDLDARSAQALATYRAHFTPRAAIDALLAVYRGAGAP